MTVTRIYRTLVSNVIKSKTLLIEQYNHYSKFLEKISVIKRLEKFLYNKEKYS